MHVVDRIYLGCDPWGQARIINRSSRTNLTKLHPERVWYPDTRFDRSWAVAFEALPNPYWDDGDGASMFTIYGNGEPYVRDAEWTYANWIKVDASSARLHIDLRLDGRQATWGFILTR